MARRRSRGSAGARSFRPATDWGFVNLSGELEADVTGIDADVWDLSNLMLGSALENELPETVRRMRGTWHTALSSATTATPGIRKVGIGIGIASEIALATGAVPSIFGDGYWDGWMWIATAHLLLPATANIYGSAGTPLEVSTIDAKAMRRLEDNHLFLRVEMETDSGVVDTFLYSLYLRALFSMSGTK